MGGAFCGGYLQLIQSRFLLIVPPITQVSRPVFLSIAPEYSTAHLSQLLLRADSLLSFPALRPALPDRNLRQLIQIIIDFLMHPNGWHVQVVVQQCLSRKRRHLRHLLLVISLS